MRRVLLFPHRGKVDNPYLELLTDDVPDTVVRDWTVRNALRRWDVVHLHWPETVWAKGSRRRRLLRGGAFLLLLALARLRGARIVETIHNIEPHDGASDHLSTWMRSRVTQLLDGIQVLDSTSIARLPPALASMPQWVVPHGHYGERFPSVGRAPGPPFGLFHVGFLRPYKGTEEVIECFAALARPHWRLHIAGEADDATRAADLKRRMAGLDATFDPRFLDTNELAELAARCHLCVLPFRAIENSGSVVMALSLGLPVLAPDIGTLRTLQAQVGAEWIDLYRPPLTPDILGAAMARFENRGVEARPDLEPLSWPTIRIRLADAYRDLSQSPAKTGAGRLQIRARRTRSARRTAVESIADGGATEGQSGGNS